MSPAPDATLDRCGWFSPARQDRPAGGDGSASGGSPPRLGVWSPAGGLVPGRPGAFPLGPGSRSMSLMEISVKKRKGQQGGASSPEMPRNRAVSGRPAGPRAPVAPPVRPPRPPQTGRQRADGHRAVYHRPVRPNPPESALRFHPPCWADPRATPPLMACCGGACGASSQVGHGDAWTDGTHREGGRSCAREARRGWAGMPRGAGAGAGRAGMPGRGGGGGGSVEPESRRAAAAGGDPVGKHFLYSGTCVAVASHSCVVDPWQSPPEAVVGADYEVAGPVCAWTTPDRKRQMSDGMGVRSNERPVGLGWM